MKCIFCNCKESKVIDSRYVEDNNSIRRRRECLNKNCQKRFNTYETIEIFPIMIIKNDQSRQPFEPSKVKQGILRACEKRPVSVAQMNEIVQEVEKQLQNSMRQEITSTEVGEIVMDKLKELDEVAYIRFASVYRKFADITHFMQFIKEFEDVIDKK